MARNQISFETLDSIVGAADLYFAGPDDDGPADESDALRIRPATRGKGYRPEGFALVMRDETVLYGLLACAGLIARELEEDEDGETLCVLDFARCVQVDSLGRSTIIVYWPDWEVTGLPEHLSKD